MGSMRPHRPHPLPLLLLLLSELKLFAKPLVRLLMAILALSRLTASLELNPSAVAGCQSWCRVARVQTRAMRDARAPRMALPDSRREQRMPRRLLDFRAFLDGEAPIYGWGLSQRLPRKGARVPLVQVILKFALIERCLGKGQLLVWTGNKADADAGLRKALYSSSTANRGSKYRKPTLLLGKRLCYRTEQPPLQCPVAAKRLAAG